MLQAAQKRGWHWVGQMIDGETGRFRPLGRGGERDATVARRWFMMMCEQAAPGELRPQARYNPARGGEEGNECSKRPVASRVVWEKISEMGPEGAQETGGSRVREYEFQEGQPLLWNNSKRMVWVSDGSLTQGCRAGTAAYPVQNATGSFVHRLVGKQSVPTAELKGAWAQLI